MTSGHTTLWISLKRGNYTSGNELYHLWVLLKPSEHHSCIILSFMDPKTRRDFDLSVWNPGAINLTDNQIYETCDEFRESENHYCTPVPSRQTSGVLSTTSTTPLTKSEESGSKLRRMLTCIGICIFLLLAFALIFIGIGCGGYAILEIQRLQEEIVVLRSDVATLRRVQGGDVSVLNETIAMEAQVRNTRLTNLEERIQVASIELSKQMAGNFSLLRSDVENGLSSLSDSFQENLTSLANFSFGNFVDLASTLNFNITMVSNKLNQLENETEMTFSNLEDSIYQDFLSLQANTSRDIQQLSNRTEERLASINSQFEDDVRQKDSQILTLERDAYRNISELTSTHKIDFDHLSTTRRSDKASLESLITTSVEDLRNSTLHSNAELVTLLSRLGDETYFNISRFEISKRISRSSHRRCSVKKGVRRNFAKFTGKHQFQSPFLNKPATFLKKCLWHWCFPVNFAKFLRAPSLQNTYRRLLLDFSLRDCRMSKGQRKKFNVPKSSRSR